MQKIAIYDMDRTITRHGTYSPFLLHMAARRAPWRLALAPVAAVCGLLYVSKFLDRAGLKQINQRLLLGKRPKRSALQPAINAFADRVLARECYAGALAQIAADRAAGYRLVLATASYRLYVEAIAQRLGFDDVIATELDITPDGAVIPHIHGSNCYGSVKLAMIREWMDGQGLDRADLRIRSYSDHVSDRPMLELADEAFATNPHPPLRALAAAKGWPVLEWGKG